MRSTLSLVLAVGLASTPAFAQPAPRSSLTSDVLASDLQLDAVFRCHDLNGDGDSDDAGESTPFFDNTNASTGFGAGAVFAIAIDQNGTAYVGDGDTDAIYALRDLNGDGDANDAGEAIEFFSFASTLQPLQTPNGIGIGADGSVYAITAGAGSTLTADYIYKMKDVNGDGDANDPGEFSTFADLSALVPNSSAFGLTVDGSKVYFVDLRGGDADTLFLVEDLSGDGVIQPGELKEFYTTARLLGPSVGFGVAAEGGSVYIADGTGSIPIQKVWRLTDLNADGVIDTAAELREVWSEANVPAGLGINSLFDLAVGPPGVMALISSGSDLQDNILFLNDLNNDGDFADAGETTARVRGNGAGLFAENGRAIRFIPQPLPACDPDVNQDGNVDQDDVSYLINVIGGGANPTGIDPDFNHDGNADQDDVSALINTIGGGGCP